MQTLFQLPEPQIELLNPLVRIYGQAEPGLKCKDCKHFLRFRQATTWFKCALRNGGGRATDHRANWQACARFQSLDPKCPECAAKRLADCIPACRQAGVNQKKEGWNL